MTWHLAGSHVLGCGEVAGHGVLAHGVNDNFKERTLAAAIELERFVDGAVLFLNLLVVGEHEQREFVLLGIGLFELEADNREMSRVLILLERELEIVAVSPVLEKL